MKQIRSKTREEREPSFKTPGGAIMNFNDGMAKSRREFLVDLASIGADGLAVDVSPERVAWSGGVVTYSRSVTNASRRGVEVLAFSRSWVVADDL